MQSTLPRIDIEKSYVEERKQLLADAGSKLGYKAGISTSLLSTLISIDIIPFKTDEVNLYKQSKVKTGMWSGTKAWLTWMVCNFLGASLFVFSGIHFGFHDTIFMDVLAFTTGISIIIWLCCVNSLRGHGHRTNFQWKQDWISNYHGLMPDHVLHKAIQIRDAHKDHNPSEPVYFGVDALVAVNENKIRPEPDPFLVVKNNKGEEYYIEQWDEKDLPRIIK